jgi:hypothetical protein
MLLGNFALGNLQDIGNLEHHSTTILLLTLLGFLPLHLNRGIMSQQLNRDLI